MEKIIMLPGPTNISNRVMNAMIRQVINHRGQEFRELYKRVVEKSKYLFQTSSDVLILTSSGTGAVEAAVTNTVSKDESVIVPVFGEFSERLAETVRIQGARVIEVRAEHGEAPEKDEIISRIDESNSSSIFLVHNETSTGVVLPYLEEVCRYAKEKGMLVVVDAISSLGGYRIDVEKIGIDVCITGSQKCIAAPPGLSLLSLSKDALEKASKVEKRTRYFDIPRYIEYQKRWETPFTPAIPLFYALDEALSELMEEGLDNRVRRHQEMSSKLYEGLESIGLDFVAKKEYRSRTVVAALYPEQVQDKEFRNKMESDFGVVVAGGFGKWAGKVFRIGCMGIVNQEHVARTLEAVSSIIKTKKVKQD